MRIKNCEKHDLGPTRGITTSDYSKVSNNNMKLITVPNPLIKLLCPFIPCSLYHHVWGYYQECQHTRIPVRKTPAELSSNKIERVLISKEYWYFLKPIKSLSFIYIEFIACCASKCVTKTHSFCI